MTDLLDNPFIQSAAIPFVVSLLVAWLLRPHGWYWAGLSAVAGFVATAYLLTDLQLFPLRSDRKIFLLGGGAVVLGLLLDLFSWRRMAETVALLAGGAAALWLVWPRFRFMEGADLWLLAIAGTLYVACLSISTIGLRNQAVKADVAVLALGLGTGLSALLGATALYGQLGAAIAAATGARIFVYALGKPVNAGAVMVLPLVLVSGLLGLGAVVYAKLPWFSLLALLLIPLLVRVPLSERLPRLLRLVLLLLLALLPATLAVFLTWREAGAPLL